MDNPTTQPTESRTPEQMLFHTTALLQKELAETKERTAKLEAQTIPAIAHNAALTTVKFGEHLFKGFAAGFKAFISEFKQSNQSK